MTTIIALLRGVNVTGNHMIKMADLRALCESLGHCNVQTYVQSGNVVFQTKGRDAAAKIAAKIEGAIEKTHGFRPDVVLRTVPEMREVIAKNPFAKRKDIEPGKLIITFLATEPTAESRAALSLLKPDPEELCANGREVYVHFPDGMGRSKFVPVLGRALKGKGTARNWNTVTKLLEMAEELEKTS
ncbi:MAG: DUF1697 domain-containing protein [Candidatus Korobacteraceae bacterium]